MSDEQMLEYLKYSHSSHANINQMVSSFFLKILGHETNFVQIPGLVDPVYWVYHGHFEGYTIVLLYQKGQNWLTTESHDVVIVTDNALWKLPDNPYEGKPPKYAVFRYKVSKDQLSEKLTKIFSLWLHDKQTYAEVYQSTGKAVWTISHNHRWYIADFYIETVKFQDKSGWIFVIEGWDYDDRTVYPLDVEPSRALLLEWLDKIITDVE